MARAKENDDKITTQDNLESDVKATSTVAPVESVDDVPVPEKDACWNCKARLDSEGKCSECGFDKSLIYNLNLEVEKAAQRQAQQVTK